MSDVAAAVRRRLGTFAMLAAATLAVSACGHDPVAFTDIPTALQSTPIEYRGCLPQPVLGMTADPGDSPAGIPYPTPAGKRVTPEITGIPLPPGSREVDGFKANWQGRDATVQVFQVPMDTVQVFEFFAEVMVAQGWAQSSAQGGVAGLTCEYLPHPPQGGANPPPSEWVMISSVYIPRSGEQASSSEPPPGFRGKGVPFAPRSPGVATFSILTPR